VAESGKWRGLLTFRNIAFASKADVRKDFPVQIAEKHESPGLGVLNKKATMLNSIIPGKKRFFYFILLFSIIIITTGCNKDSDDVEITEEGLFITGDVVTEIQRACKYPDGTFCTDNCCISDQICDNEESAYMGCDLVTGEWIETTYSDAKCESECKTIEIKEEDLSDEEQIDTNETKLDINISVPQNQGSLLNCTQGWKCIDSEYVSYQISNCSFIAKEFCEKGCVNNSCVALCTPGDYTCDGDTSRICDEDGDHWSYHKECKYGCNNGTCQPRYVNYNQTNVTVSQVIDGDTVKLDTDDEISLIGIKAPGSGQAYYDEGIARLKELVEGKTVILHNDTQDKDPNDKFWRYVFVDSDNINVKLVQEGFANVSIVSPNTRYQSELEAAWQQCLSNGVNLCNTTTQNDYIGDNCFSVLNFNYDAGGDDNQNLTDEYFTLKNSCSYSIDMTSWTATDDASHTYTAPTFNLGNGTNVTIITGSGSDTSTELYWGRGSAVWNNGGDTLYLNNSAGQSVLSYTYP
tara:strand:+ start:2147 stop:3706 length:1560 start_codon:yes stop_codon:yes gene_type:complete